VPIELGLREKIARVRNSILALEKKFLAIYPDTIMDTFKASRKYDVKTMLETSIIDEITLNASKR